MYEAHSPENIQIYEEILLFKLLINNNVFALVLRDILIAFEGDNR